MWSSRIYPNPQTKKKRKKACFLLSSRTGLHLLQSPPLLQRPHHQPLIITRPFSPDISLGFPLNETTAAITRNHFICMDFSIKMIINTFAESVQRAVFKEGSERDESSLKVFFCFLSCSTPPLPLSAPFIVLPEWMEIRLSKLVFWCNCMF